VIIGDAADLATRVRIGNCGSTDIVAPFDTKNRCKRLRLKLKEIYSNSMDGLFERQQPNGKVSMRAPSRGIRTTKEHISEVENARRKEKLGNADQVNFLLRNNKRDSVSIEDRIAEVEHYRVKRSSVNAGKIGLRVTKHEDGKIKELVHSRRK
jgi:hypothetical protein